MRGFEPVITVNSHARMVADIYKLASVDEQAEMAYLVGNFKSTNKLSDTIFDAVYKTMFGGR